MSLRKKGGRAALERTLKSRIFLISSLYGKNLNILVSYRSSVLFFYNLKLSFHFENLSTSFDRPLNEIQRTYARDFKRRRFYSLDRKDVDSLFPASYNVGTLLAFRHVVARPSQLGARAGAISILSRLRAGASVAGKCNCDITLKVLISRRCGARGPAPRDACDHDESGVP